MKNTIQRAESPMICVGADPCVRPDLGTHMGVPLRAESPIGNSVGRSPTLGGPPKCKPCKGVGNRIAPLQGLISFATRYVGLRPTLLPSGLQPFTRLLLSILLVFASGFIAGAYPLAFLVAACAVCVAQWTTYLHRPFALRRYFILDPQTPDAKSLADVFSTLVGEVQRTQKTIILRLATFTTDPGFRPRLNLTHDNDIEISGVGNKRHALRRPRVWLADHPLPFNIPLTRSLSLVFSPCSGERVRVAEEAPREIPMYARVGGVLLIAFACYNNLNTLLAFLLGFSGEMYLMRRG